MLRSDCELGVEVTAAPEWRLRFSPGNLEEDAAHAGGVNQHTFFPFRHSNIPESPLSATVLHTALGTSCPSFWRAKAGTEATTKIVTMNTATTTTLTMRFKAPPLDHTRSPAERLRQT